MRRITFLIFFFGLSVSKSSFASTDTLTYKAFITLLLGHHPIAAMADLRAMAGKAEFNKAQGAFEPIIGAQYDRKYFDGKNYFSLFTSELKVPLWIGEVKAGYDYYYGAQINPENLLPQDGMPYVGVSLPLIQNLFTDKKRTQLRQAQLFKESASFERVSMLNDLLVNATVAYWDWSAAYQKYLLNYSALELAQQRHQMIIQSVLLGDRPMIDTTESITQVQYRQVAAQQALTEWFQATFDLSNYCWSTNQSPVLLDTSVIAEIPESKFSLKEYVLDDQLNQLSSQPELNIYRLKVKSLDYERKLKAELLKPQLNANYYLMGNGLDFSASSNQAFFTQRYKFGVDFQMPLLFAQSRSEYKLAKYKLQEVKYTYDLKQLSVANKVKIYWYELENVRSQIGNLRQIVVNNKQLLEAEQDRFFNGESNVFLINARENKYIESQEKLYELYAKLYKSESILLQQTGKLLSDIIKQMER